MNWKIAIKGFEHYLQLEKSLSENSVEAYVRDVHKLAEFMDYNFPKVSVTQVGLKHLQELVKWINEIGMSARSQSRIVSGIRAFYKYLLLENEVKTDPTELLDLPRLGRKLPDTISKSEIDALIGAIDRSKPEGERNRAILETLYSCGLRVSELVNLQISKLHLNDGYIRVIGKGNKERLVPIGGVAVKYINLYLESVRPHVPVQSGHEDFVFLNRRGKQLTRVMIFTIIKQLAEQIGLKKKVSPHTFRHSFATDLVNGGADLRAVQEMLGHESITTTEIYTHLDRSYLQQTINEFHPRYKV